MIKKTLFLFIACILPLTAGCSSSGAVPASVSGALKPESERTTREKRALKKQRVINRKGCTFAAIIVQDHTPYGAVLKRLFHPHTTTQTAWHLVRVPASLSQRIICIEKNELYQNKDLLLRAEPPARNTSLETAHLTLQIQEGGVWSIDIHGNSGGITNISAMPVFDVIIPE